MEKTCASCGKSVYPMEQLKCLDQIWHKACFKCTSCGLTLNMKNYKAFEKKPYCNAHCPQQKSYTFVTDRQDIQRVKQNTAVISKAGYAAIGKKISIGGEDSDAPTPVVVNRRMSETPAPTHLLLARQQSAQHQPGSINDFDPEKHNTVDRRLDPHAGRRGSTIFVSRELPSAQQPGADAVPEVADDELPKVTSEPQTREAQEAPLETQEAPLETQEAPLETQEAPLETQEAPLETQEAPLETQEAPREIQAAPLQTQEAPLETQEAPLQTQEAPLETQEAPLQTQEARLETQEAPLQTQEAPLEIQAAPLQTQEAPLDTQDAPLQPKETPPQTLEAPLQPPEPREASDLPQELKSADATPEIISSATAETPAAPETVTKPVAAVERNRGRCFRAQFSYTAQDTDEVSFSEGDLVIHGDPIDAGWMYGILAKTGQYGMMPYNYMEEIQ